MNRSSTILLILVGLIVGWWLPVGRFVHAPENDPTALSSSEKEENRRATRKLELLRQLLDEEEYSLHRRESARSLSDLLPLLRGENFRQSDMDSILAMDPRAAIDFILSDPCISQSLGEEVTYAWARKDPEQAIRHLWTKSNYRADDCLAIALTVGYSSQPELVAEVIRSKPRHWQEYHLQTIYKGTYDLWQEETHPNNKSDDPFVVNGKWLTGKFGEDLLPCLADDELREKARKFWDHSPPDNPAEPEAKKPPLDLAQFDPDNWVQLYDALREREQESLDALVKNGNYHARKVAIQYYVSDISTDPETWPADLTRLEYRMNQLGVIPDDPPWPMHQGPFLHGPEVAAWIDRQPLALRRAWAPTFVRTWVETEPAAAVEWARSLPEAASRDVAYQSGLIIWTHRDPTAAIAAVEALPPGDLRESAISNAAATWATLDRAAATAWLASLPDSPGKSRALERVRR